MDGAGVVLKPKGQDDPLFGQITFNHPFNQTPVLTKVKENVVVLQFWVKPKKIARDDHHCADPCWDSTVLRPKIILSQTSVLSQVKEKLVVLNASLWSNQKVQEIT